MPGPSDLPARNPLDVELVSTPELTVLRLAGELTSRVAHLLDDAFVAITSGTWPSRIVVLDLARLAFVDLSSVHILEEGRQRLEKAEIGLVLRQPPNMLLELLDITGWRDRFVIQ